MKRLLGFSLAIALCLLTSSVAAFASLLDGQVSCPKGGGPLEGVVINVYSTTAGFTFSGSGTTDAGGYYSIDLPDAQACYEAAIQLGTGESPVDPSSGIFDFCIDGTKSDAHRDWVLSSPKCTGEEEGACWLTGGGAKFSPITGTDVGESGKRHNWGGNVNPGCSPTAGDGGSWNHIDVANKLHFHGTHIEVVRCGNIDDYPPGSTSPRTPFNFIEFTGWGTLKGIQGNKVDFGTVYFFARAEDRNEPGSNGQRDGNGKDRYYLNVYTDQLNPNTTSKILVDMDGNPATIDPLIITDGNMQIHISGCDSPPPPLVRQAASTKAESAVEAPNSWGRLKVIYR